MTFEDLIMPLPRSLAFAAFALLASCGGPAEATAEPPSSGRDARAWTIGPIIKGRNYSVDMPLHPTPRRGGEFQIDLPRDPGSVHYVTFRHGSLAGKTRIVMRYRVELAPGVKIIPSTEPKGPAILTLYFQRAGDNWGGRGKFETYRWFATFASHMPIEAGDHEMVAPLNGAWTAIQTSSARSDPVAFRAALAEADQVGFVLGGGSGYGHGVYADGPARLVVTSFRVE
ncbi:hypothetical protein [Allosphingosinicella deserti]|uniref:DUF3047 domain-containing protein n=1 Tax=Allosphingosinicella deserti TaxID=2116704 RepID=A0A2P7QKK5_9SPHN|nr:hypothetical protein [Sphingomonas deserti]PSJ38517.1 hypothetical protein C7I55_19005 [Sphingomonas deserti]